MMPSGSHTAPPEDEQFPDILEHVSDGVILLDSDWRCRYLNQVAERLIQKTRDSVLGEILWDLFPEAINTIFWGEYHRAMETRQVVIVEEYFAPLETWFLVRCQPCAGGLTLYFQDTSAAKKAQAALRVSEDRFRLLTETMPQIVFISDTNAVIEYFNPQWFTYTGLSPATMKPEDWIGAIHPDDFPAVLAKWEAVRKTDEFWEAEYRLKRADCTYHWFLGRSVALRDARGQVVNWFGVATDIDDRKRAEIERAHLLERERAAHAAADLERTRLESLFEQAPAAIAILRGPAHIYELANSRYQRLIGKTELVGKPGREALPELTEQGIWDLFDRVYTTGEPFIGADFPVLLDRNGDGTLDLCYFNFVAQPFTDIHGAVAGIFIHAVEVTDQVHARTHMEDLAIQLNHERERLEIAQRAAGIGTFEWDIPNNQIVWMPELEALYGLPPGGFEGKYENWAARVHPEDLPRAEENIQAAITGGPAYHIEFRVIQPDGTLRWLLGIGDTFFTEGHPERMIGVNIDITDRKWVEQNLDFLAGASKILASSLDYETTLARVAQLGVPEIADWCAVDMRTEQNTIAQLAVAHVDPEKAEWARELNAVNPADPNAPTGVPNVLRTGKSEFYPDITDEMLVAAAHNAEELALIRRIGFSSAMTVPMMVQDSAIGAITFVAAESGRHYTVTDLAIAEEVASRAALAVENARLYREAQQAIAMRDEFMSLASHELKTPVTSLKMYTQVLQRQASRRGETDLVDRFAKMDRQIDKLTGLINDLLSVARTHGGRLEYTDEAFDLDAIVQDVVEGVQPTTAKHTIEIHGAINTPVWGDSERIGQVMTNLLTNAVKYSPDADRVIVRLSREDDHAVVRVRDFGIGISDEHQQHLFEQFYRVSDPSEKTFPGLGLGLYLAHEIVKRHGGTLCVESAKDEGATFTLTLPLTQRGRTDA